MSPRIRPLTASDRTPEQENLFTGITQGPRGRAVVLEDGALLGPFNAMLLSPVVGDRLQALGLAVQSPDTLPPLMREALILSVAASRGNRTEWDLHLPRAIAAGLSATGAESLERGEMPADGREDLRAALELSHLQLAHQPTPDEVYARASSALGERRIFEVAALVGYYDALCSIITVFDLDKHQEG